MTATTYLYQTHYYRCEHNRTGNICLKTQNWATFM